VQALLPQLTPRHRATRLVEVGVADLALLEEVGEVLVQPRPELGAEHLVLLRVGEVHGGTLEALGP